MSDIPRYDSAVKDPGDSVEIVRRTQAIDVDKGEGTKVSYYIFAEYELHFNEIAPGTVQQWHHHEAIEETVLVLKGELEVRWRNRGTTKCETIGSGDVVRVGRSVHTFANVADEDATFVVFRLVLSGEDKHEKIKNDKVVDEDYSS